MSESENRIEVLNWNYNDATETLELLIDDNGVQKTVPLNSIFLKEIIEAVPTLTEAQLINDLLKQIYKVQEERVLNARKIDELVEKLRDEHKETRKALSAIDNPAAKGKKNEILIQCAVIKSLAAEKVLLGEKRYLTKLLVQEESQLRARLAKMKSEGR